MPEDPKNRTFPPGETLGEVLRLSPDLQDPQTTEAFLRFVLEMALVEGDQERLNEVRAYRRLHPPEKQSP